MNLYYRKTGDGIPLIILHGLFGMSDNWSSLSKEFAEKGFGVYAVDARNHGRSFHSDEFSYPVMAEDVINLMKTGSIKSAHVIGHSLGGKTAMWMACQHPEYILSLLVADMAPRYYPPHHDGVISAIHSVDLESVKSRKEAEGRLREMLRDEGTIQFLLKNLYWKENDKLAWRFNLEGIEKNISSVGERLPDSLRFGGKTLFLRGERSGYITQQDEAEIKKHFPQASIETIKNAGHWLHADNPAGFMDASLKFLTSE